jgi:hypothetical protein
MQKFENWIENWTESWNIKTRLQHDKTIISFYYLLHFG